jgi:hypothetical protein
VRTGMNRPLPFWREQGEGLRGITRWTSRTCYRRFLGCELQHSRERGNLNSRRQELSRFFDSRIADCGGVSHTTRFWWWRVEFAADQSRELVSGQEQYVPVRNIAWASFWATPTAESHTTKSTKGTLYDHQ